MLQDFYREKVILVTGAAGTVGRELVRQLLAMDPAEVRLLDNNESDLFLMSEQFRAFTQVVAYLGDVRDGLKLDHLMKGVDIVFHCAAYKHVWFAEYNPFDTVLTNIVGVKNVIQAALQNQISHMIFTSSDKAVNPTSVMGTSKLMGERIVTAANIVNFNSGQIFSSVRFGNVLGSRGSVVPVFMEQIRRGGPVTLTDPGMTRFVMSIQEAGRLVLEGATLACGGEVFITKMPVMNILDLAHVMIELLAPAHGFQPEDISIELIGTKPGEKLYEELMSAEEVTRAVELPSMFVIRPAHRAFYQEIKYRYHEVLPQMDPLRPYISADETPMSPEEIKQYLLNWEVLGDLGRAFRKDAYPESSSAILKPESRERGEKVS
uniref:Polysaccharide biosynthesis protein n=1 Tax=Desulfobacca acetoxidans TaxID=60893 RepID=A0A7C3WG08_9BACT